MAHHTRRSVAPSLASLVQVPVHAKGTLACGLLLSLEKKERVGCADAFSARGAGVECSVTFAWWCPPPQVNRKRPCLCPSR